MRYSASEKFEIIELVEQSSLSIQSGPEIDVLRLVHPIPGGRDRSSGGWQAERAGPVAGGGRRIGEANGRLHWDEGRARNQATVLQEPIDGGF
jgi:hypothetical protein